MSDLSFNPNPATIMHIDLNSCFATIEQQANPLLRGQPIAVAAYASPGGCILAPSIEAKKYGVKVGMRVREGKFLCPGLKVLSPDPWKYRHIHLRLKRLVSKYTANFIPKSIDEFVLDLKDYPILSRLNIKDVAHEIKTRIKKEIGDWLTVSIGIAPNRFLAKLAASLHKPDGLDEIDQDNFAKIYSTLTLTDLCGIKTANKARLNALGIYSVSNFYEATTQKLRRAFASINGYYWYLRLRGWEIDNVIFARRSYGNSFALPKPLVGREILPILAKLVAKMSFRVRSAGFKAKGVHLAIYFRDKSFWHKGISTKELFDTRDFYQETLRLLSACPYLKPIKEIAVSSFNLTKLEECQLELFANVEKKMKVVKSIDEINKRWGNFTVSSARMMNTDKLIPDRIAFGGVKELEEFTVSQ